MGGKKTGGIVLLLVGIVVLLASVLVDAFGFGDPGSAFGIYQIAGTVVGVILAVVGLVLALRG